MIGLALGILLLFVNADIDGEVRIGPRRGLPKPATVQLLRERQIVYEQFTDLDGRFEFPAVEPGRYVVRAVYEDLPEAEVTVELINGNSRHRVPITIRPPARAPVGKTQTIAVKQLTIPKAARKAYEDGLKSRKAGNCGKALPQLKKATELAPHYGDAQNELGNCLKAQGKLVEAEAAFKIAIQYDETIYPSINLADLYVTQKRFDEASVVIQRSLAKDPTEGDLFFAMARIYFDQGQIEKAEANALEAHSRLHRTPDVHLLLAKIYLERKNTGALITQLETYLIENPSGPVADQVRKNLKALSPR
jgi:tetratricopeptide (TPR) repeat protein